MSGLRKRAALGQNFLRFPDTARALVRAAGIRAGDRVYDLGAGAGAMTHALLLAGASVIAVECDANLAAKLRRRFAGTAVTIVEADINEAAFAAPFKVVANIPFGETAATMRRLFFSAPHPDHAQLLVQREAAEKYAGIGRMTAVSLMLAPWFQSRIVCSLARKEFVPRPGVDVVALSIIRRTSPVMAYDERECWNAFVRYALGRSKSDARRTFRNLISNLQWRLLAKDLSIDPDTRLDRLSLEQWLAIYRFVRWHAPPRKTRMIPMPWFAVARSCEGSGGSV